MVLIIVSLINQWMFIMYHNQIISHEVKQNYRRFIYVLFQNYISFKTEKPNTYLLIKKIKLWDQNKNYSVTVISPSVFILGKILKTQKKIGKFLILF